MMKSKGSNDPHDYTNNSDPQCVTAYELINQFSNKIKPTDVIVDIGCGTGKISFELAKLAGKVYAFDLSKDAINYAKDQYPSKTHANLFFFEANATEFTLPEKVDWVFSANTLHWLRPEEQLKAFACIKQALKPSGQVMVTFGMRHEPLWSIIDESILDLKWSEYFYNFKNPRVFYTLEGYKKLLLSADFEIVSIVEKPVEYKFQDFEKFIKYIQSWLPHVNCIPNEKKELYMNYIGKKYLERQPVDTDNSICITFNVLEISAKPFFLSNKIKKEPEKKSDNNVSIESLFSNFISKL